MLTEEAKLINERLKTVMNPNRIYLFGSYAKNTQRADRDVELGGFFNRTLGKIDEVLLDLIVEK